MGGTAPVLLDAGKEILHQVAPLVGFLKLPELITDDKAVMGSC